MGRIKYYLWKTRGKMLRNHIEMRLQAVCSVQNNPSGITIHGSAYFKSKWKGFYKERHFPGTI